MYTILLLAQLKRLAGHSHDAIIVLGTANEARGLIKDDG
jgi:hypothetical protein